MSNANTYTGTTAINQGTIVVTANNAFGSSSGGVTVATVRLPGALKRELHNGRGLTVAGTGPAGNGAIESLGGTNTFAGPITLSGNAAIGVDANTLTLSGSIAANYVLTFIGQASATVNGAVSGNSATSGLAMNDAVHIASGQ